MKVTKRDGSHENFSIQTLKSAIRAAFKSAKVKYTKDDITNIAEGVKIFDEIPVEDIQDQLESLLMANNYPEVAKEFILYREKKAKLREWVKSKKDFIENYKQSNNTANSTIDDNSNVACKNIGVLNAEIHKADNIQINRGMIGDKLKAIFPDFNYKQYCKDLASHVIYKNDESSFAGAIAPYCCSITMYPFLNHGLEKIGGLSAYPKNLDSFAGMYINLIFATSAQFAGAVATSEILVYFNYFAEKEWGKDYYKHVDWIVRPGGKLLELANRTHVWCSTIEELRNHDFGNDADNKLRDEIVEDATRPLTEEEMRTNEENIAKGIFNPVKAGDGTRTIGSTITQLFQQIVYSINQPAASRGLQSSFVNFSYFDKPFFEGMFGDFIFPDDEGTRPTWEAVSWLQKYFMQWFNNERLHTILTFPVESFALVYQDGKFLDQESADFVAEEYARGHSFFTYISDTVDSLSSCCRLKNKIQTKEFNFTNGNMGVQTGSKSVITLNLSRITQDWFKALHKKDDTVTKAHIELYYNDLKDYINEILERVYKYHTAYNELLWDVYDAGLLPVYKAGFINLDKQYLTIGINGLNQAAEFLELTCRDNEAYATFCQTIFGCIKDANTAHKGKFNGHQLTYNTECVPAESLAVKNYNWDKADGYWVPEDTNLYASYIFKPNDQAVDIFEKIRMHGANYIGDFLDGGSAAHLNLSEHLSKEQYAHILNYAAKQGCQYFTFNIPMARCPKCGHISNTPFSECPKCGNTEIDLYTRIIGYLTKIKNWSAGRYDEHKSRIYTKKSLATNDFTTYETA